MQPSLETVLDSNTVYDWKIEHTGSMKKCEDRFNKEVHIPMAKQPTTVKDKSIAALQTATSAMGKKVILELTIVWISHPFMMLKNWMYSNNWTITAVNESAYNPTIDELDVKLPATKKVQDVLLEDLVLSSRLSPPTDTNKFGIGEQLPVSQDVNNIHVFNDNNKSTSKENEEQEHPKMMEVPVASQQTDTAMESELVSKSTTRTVNLDHMKELQECMDSYNIGNGVHSFDMIALTIGSYECTCNICLVVTKSSAHNYWQYSSKQHSGCNFHISFDCHHSTGLLRMKNPIFS